MRSDKLQHLANQLETFLPRGTSTELAALIIHHKVQFKVSRPRNSKLGDYRPPGPNGGHRISVNGDLNVYAFYITSLHEFAHLMAFEKYGLRIAPHGSEWKNIFGRLLNTSLQNNVFPANLRKEIVRYLQSPTASSCTDHALTRALRKYDDSTSQLLEELPEKSRFVINGNRIFEKGPKVRKRYRCIDQQNQRIYLISAIAEVECIA